MDVQTNKLAVLSDVEQRLATVQTVDEAKDIRDKAEAVRVYVKSAKHGLGIQNRAAAIKIQAELKAGELLKAMDLKPGRPESGNGSTLEPLGISKAASHRWQTMSAVPRERVLELEAEKTEAGEELTSVGIYDLARGIPHVAQNAGESEWYTPKEIIEVAREVLGAIDLDPASHEDAQAVIQATRFFTAEDDGLLKDWTGRVWLNPPYSHPLVARFCDKLVHEYRGGHVSAAITLTNNATETTWGQDLQHAASAVCFPKGRVEFWAPDRESIPLQGQMLCYFGTSPATFAKRFEECGKVWVDVVPHDP